MSNVAVIGSQWGDEGKGKIVDWLSERADMVVRFQGGHNAGHTLVIDGVEYKLSLLPSGIVRKGKKSVIGNGVVVDPVALLREIETLRRQGVAVSPDNLIVSESVSLILLDLSHWKVVIGGSSLPHGLAASGLARGINVFAAYGLSETCPLLTVAQIDPDHADDLTARCRAGWPAPMVDLRIVDDNMVDVPRDTLVRTGAKGILHLTGNTVLAAK